MPAAALAESCPVFFFVSVVFLFMAEVASGFEALLFVQLCKTNAKYLSG
jgi:hypothetical protein